MFPHFYKDYEKHHAVTFDWSTDGCSSVPSKLLVLDLHEACREHDFYYRNANTLKRLDMPVSRLKADNRLFKAITDEVKRKLGFRSLITATLYYLGVRAIGWMHYGKRS